MGGFDSFFENLSTSSMDKQLQHFGLPENFEKELKKMEKNMQKAANIHTPMEQYFSQNSTPKPTKAAQTKEKEEKSQEIEIKYFEKKNPKTWGFAGVAGLDELKKELKEQFIEPLQFKFFMQNLEAQEDSLSDKQKKLYKKLYSTYEKFQVSIPTGMLLYGPPGTGKTFITKKLAQELNAGMIQKSVGEFGSSYIHETSKNIKAFFDAAKKASETGPIILFLDEIDSLVSTRTNKVDASKAEEVSQFLQEFTALEEAPNLIVIGATNRPDHLDSAILRSGRFDKKIYLGPPDEAARKELFKIFIEKEERPHKQIDYKKLATLTENYVAADIETICEEASRISSAEILKLVSKIKTENVSEDELDDHLDDHFINMELLEQVIKNTEPSTKYVDMNIYELWKQEK